MNTGSSPLSRKSDWQSFLCKVNGSLASVFVDLDLSKNAPLLGKTKLVWLWICLNSPRVDGLSSNEEFDALCNFEDDLTASVNLHQSLQYAGRITTNGRREFYFYAQDDFDFESIVDDVLQRHEEYSFQLGEKVDPSWGHYFNTLFPGKDGLEQIEKSKQA